MGLTFPRAHRRAGDQRGAATAGFAGTALVLLGQGCTMITDADLAAKLGGDGNVDDTGDADNGIDTAAGAHADTGTETDAVDDTDTAIDSGADTATDSGGAACPHTGDMVIAGYNGEGVVPAGYEMRFCATLYGTGRVCSGTCDASYAEVQVITDGAYLAFPADVSAGEPGGPAEAYWNLCIYSAWPPAEAVGDVVTCTAETSAGEWTQTFTVVE